MPSTRMYTTHRYVNADLGLLKSGTASSAVIQNVVKPISVTYADLVSLINSSSLIQGRQYLLNDFKTTYTNLGVLNTTIHTVAVEPLLLTATSTNTIDTNVMSTVYPQDEIHYSYLNSGSADLITNLTGSVYGVILYRKDWQKQVSAFYDWRVVRFRRYKVDLTPWTNTTFGNNTVGNANTLYWLPSTSFDCGRSPLSAANITFTAASSGTDYQDFLTFNAYNAPTQDIPVTWTTPSAPTGVNNVTLGNMVWNTVFMSSAQNIYFSYSNGSNILTVLSPQISACSQNTFVAGIANCTITSWFANNIFYGSDNTSFYVNQFECAFLNNLCHTQIFGVKFYAEDFYNYSSSTPPSNGVIFNTFSSFLGGGGTGGRSLIRSYAGSLFQNCIYQSTGSSACLMKMHQGSKIQNSYLVATDYNIYNNVVVSGGTFGANVGAQEAACKTGAKTITHNGTAGDPTLLYNLTITGGPGVGVYNAVTL